MVLYFRRLEIITKTVSSHSDENSSGNWIP